MDCSRSRMLRVVILLASIAVCGTPLFSQDPPDQATGRNPSSTYHRELTSTSWTWLPDVCIFIFPSWWTIPSEEN